MTKFDVTTSARPATWSRAWSSLKVMSMLIAGLVFSNLASANDISPDEFMKLDKSEIIVLDVRTAEEYADGHVPSAINIPVAELSDTFKQLTDKDQQVVVYCRSGFRAARAINFLEEQGYTNLIHLDGDYGRWEKEGREIEKPE